MTELINLLKENKISVEDAACLLQLQKYGKEISSPETYLSMEWKDENCIINSYDDFSGKIILFDNDAHFFTDFKRCFPQLDSVNVSIGNCFEKVAGDLYTINPLNPTDYNSLLQDIVKEDKQPIKIIFKWMMDIPQDEKLLQESKNRVLSFYILCQEIGNNSFISDVKGIVPYASDTLTSVFSEALGGFTRSLSKETTNLIFSTISTKSTDSIQIYRELLEVKKESKDIRYYKQQRQIKVLSKDSVSFDVDPTISFAFGKTYLITGGLGKIAFGIAKFLAFKYKSKLILTGRKKLTEENKNQIEILKRLGSEVIFIQSDIAKKEDIQLLIHQLENSFDELHGIFHLAGVNKDAMLFNKSVEEFEEEIESKVSGTIHLDEFTKRYPLDFFISSSSISSVIGISGQTGYSYANAFLDAFSQYRNQLKNEGKRQGHTIALNWSVWKDGNMHIPEIFKEYYAETLGFKEISYLMGVKSLLTAQYTTLSSLIVLNGEISRIKNAFLQIPSLLNQNKEVFFDQRKSIPSFENENRMIFDQKLKEELFAIVAEHTKIDKSKLNGDTDLSRYGFDSISLIEFSNKINKYFSLNVTPSIFFENYTLELLKNYLINKFEAVFVERYIIVNECFSSKNGAKENVSSPKSRFNSILDLQKVSNTLIPEHNHNKEIKSAAALQKTPVDEVAIIGMASVLPKSDNTEDFWNNLKHGKDLITEIPEDRWKWESVYGNPEDEGNKTDIIWGGFVNNFDAFDYEFFNISYREAQLMDPQQRLFLQTAWTAIEDAGYNPYQLNGTNTAVYVGVASADYTDLIIHNNLELEPHFSTGTGHSIVANRISYLLNLHGPSESLDTACSSSLIAIHKAAENIHSGDCDMAIAGGVNILLTPKLFISFGKAGMLSKDGKCRTFDKDANGYVRGEGVGVVVLKSLKKALEDGDHIYGIIKSSGVNHGGKSSSLTAPNPKSQANLIKSVYKKANIKANTISYIETHGTGTKLGDPVEIEGLLSAFSEVHTNDKKCGLGSVKTNIGHLETAAGVAGVVKVLLSFKNKALPPTIHYKNLNPYITIENSPFYIVDKLQPWNRLKDEENQEIPRRAGVSSFGFGGSNAHLLLEEYEQTPAEQIGNELHLFLFTARKTKSLNEVVDNFVVFIEENKNSIQLSELAYTLQYGRTHFKERLAIVASTIEELLLKLKKLQLQDCIKDSNICGSSSTSDEIKNNTTVEEKKAWLKEKALDKISASWLQGEFFDWESLYDSRPKRMPLPGYPFQKTRCWIPINQSKESKDQGDTTLKEMLFIAPFWQDEAIQEASIKSDNFLFITDDTAQLLELTRNWSESKTAVQAISFMDKDHDRIKKELRSKITDCTTILFESSFIENEADNNRLEEKMESLFLILKFIINNHLLDKVKLLLASFQDNGIIAVVHESLEGLLKSIAAEYPELNYKGIVLDRKEGDNINSSNLLRELKAPFDNSFVLYSNAKRKSRQYKQVINPAFETEKLSIKTEGIYLITGGGGALGSIFAKDIMKQGGKVVLSGRSDISDAMKLLLNSLSSNFFTSEYYKSDISSADETQQLIRSLSLKYGRINGIIHAAGMNIGKPFEETTIEDIRQSALIKINGALNLDKALLNESLDFLVFFSSMISVSGTPGQAAYSYSNAFLNGFSNSRNHAVRSGKKQGATISICWPLWENGGMKMPVSHATTLTKRFGIHALPTEKGVQVWNNLSLENAVNCMFLYGESEKLIRFVQEKLNRKTIGFPIVNDVLSIENKGVASVDMLVEVFAKVLRLPKEEIITDASFDELGLDSILINKINSEMEKFIPDFPKTLLFEYKNIDQLAEHIAAAYSLILNKAITKTSEVFCSESDTIKDHKSGASVLESTNSESEGIAIIGISGKYSGADNLDELWDNLFQGLDLITEIPEDRWDIEKNYDFNPENSKNGTYYCKHGGFLKNVAHFDPLFFKISAKDAEIMDPQERLFLQTVWNSVEDAGYTQEKLSNKETINNEVGVFAGVTSLTYLLNNPGKNQEGDYSIPTSQPWSVANRVSYLLNFTGPSLPFDTACSSSLLAIHYACKALQDNECKMAIAGGVNLYLHPSKYIHLSRLRMLSHSGKCHAFGKDADGFVPGEGVGSIVLKKLKDAEKDGDRIYAVLKGSSVNHGGRTNGYSVPNVTAQSNVIKAALRKADVNPETISFIEAHGTGTGLGDPIEIAGLEKAFGQNSEISPCSIGSIKSNIGHTEAAAGIASLTKVVLQMRNKYLVPTINCEEINEKIDLSSQRFKIQKTGEPWKNPVIEGQSYPLRAGVSSFGAGGINVHLVVEEYLSSTKPEINGNKKKHLIILSARNTINLKQYAKSLADYLQKRISLSKREAFETFEVPTLAEFAYTLQQGRESMVERLAFISDNLHEVEQTLRDFSNYDETQNTFVSTLSSSKIKEFLHEEEVVADIENCLKAWLEGRKIDWNCLYQVIPSQLSLLPGYPFLGKRYWYTTNKETENDAPIKKELKYAILEPNSIDRVSSKITSTLRRDAFYLKDHQVNEDNILPGAAYIEMIRTASELITGKKVSVIKKMIWVSPCIVKKETATLVITFKEREQYLDFKVHGQDEAGAELLYFQGITVLDDVLTENIDTSIPIEKYIKTCSDFMTSEDVYLKFKKMGMNYGASFRVIEKIWVSKSFIISRIHISSEALAEGANMLLNPALLDGVLQSIIGFHSDNNDMIGRTFLPFMLKEIELIKPITETCFCLITRNSLKNNQETYSFTISDTNGRVLALLNDFIVGEKQIAKKVEEKPNLVDLKSELMFFTSKWSESKGALESIQSKKTDVLWLFSDRDDLHKEFISAYAGTIVFINRGDNYKETNHLEYTLNLQTAKDFEKLYDRLNVLNLLPTNIISFWNEDTDWIHRDAIESQLFPSFYFPINLTKIFIKERIKQKVKVLFAFKENGTGDLFNKSVSGLAKTIKREYQKLQIHTVIFENKDSLSDAFVAGVLLKELNSEDDSMEVRYSSNKRNVLKIHNVASDEIQTNEIIKDQGIYLITGGKGELAKMIGIHLAEKKKITLCLTDILDKDEKTEAYIALLKKWGTTVYYHKADIGDFEQVQDLIAACLARFNTINGIIHTAGNIRDTFIIHKKEEEIEKVLSPKINGSLNIDLASCDVKLDFMLMYSSIAAFTGNVGQADYVFGSRFQNEFVEYRESLRERGKRHGRSICINWPLWKEGGMRTDPQTEKYFRNTSGMDSLKTLSGLKAFDFAFQQKNNHLIVVEGDPDKMGATLNSVSNETINQTSSTMKTETISKKQKIEEVVLLIIFKTLGIDVEDVDVNSEINEYGFDSVSLTAFANELNDQLGISLTPAIFFEYPLINDFIDYLCQEELAFEEPFVEIPLETKDPADELAIPIQQTESRTEIKKESKSAVAIIGMSGVFPKSSDINEFWENLVSGKDTMSIIPAERWDWKKQCDLAEIEYVKKCAFMKEVDKFDASFFKISPREAALMDPAQRIFLETVWNTIEDAGYKPSDLSGTDTGLFVGFINPEYADILMEEEVEIEAHLATGVSRSILANRISYLLNIKGPSEPIDTACSSSLVAIDRGVECIQSGKCKMVIAGGVNVILSSRVHLSYNKAGMLSPDSQSKAFDKEANGYARGEGSAAILLKSLDQAIKDGDTIYGIIAGTAVNHSGSANSLTAPNPNAQAELLVEVYKNAGIDPKTVSYIETHGTGTSLGDPIEINGLKKAFKKLYSLSDSTFPSDKHIGIGAVKTNIGHLEAAAGIAGVIKVLLSLQNKLIPGNRNFNSLNPFIELENTPFYIIDKNQKWETNKDRFQRDLPRRSGVSSFGFGGSNSHVIIEEYQHIESSRKDSERDEIIVLSAKSKERLKVYAEKLVGHLLRPSPASMLEDNKQVIIDAFAEDLRRSIADKIYLNEQEIDLLEEIQNLEMDNFIVSNLINELQEKYNIPVTQKIFLNQSSLYYFAKYCCDNYSKELISFYKNKNRINLNNQPVLRTDLFLRDIAFTLQLGRDEMEERVAIVSSNVTDLCAKLQSFISNQIQPEIIIGTIGNSREDRTIHKELGFEEVRQLYNSGDEIEIARQWVAGTKIMWSREGGKRISLPGYPFERVRHWIKLKNLSETQTNLSNAVADSKETTTQEKGAEVVRFESNSQLVEDLSIRLLTDAFFKMSFFDRIQNGVTKNILRRNLGIREKHIRLFEALLDILNKQGIIDIHDDVVLLGRNTSYELISEQSETLEIHLKEFGNKHPEFCSHLDLLMNCTSNLSLILKGEILATDVLFPNSSMYLVENVYKGNISADYYNSALIVTLKNNVSQKLSEGGNKKIRILEIGAGTGGTSEMVLNELNKYSDRVSYTYTDISPAFIKYGRTKYGSKFDFVAFKILNIEKDPVGQGFEAGEFDIILAANVLHATKNISVTLGNVNRLIKKGGTLLINELTNAKRFLTLTFGLLDGWWLYEDTDKRQAHAPLLNISQWQTEMESAGFAFTSCLGTQQDSQSIVSAIKESSLTNKTNENNDPKVEQNTIKQSTNSLLENKSSHANISNKNDLNKQVSLVVKDSISITLDISAESINTSTPYIDYGVDSILAVECVKRINKKLGVTLRTTDFFNYVDIESLVEYICVEFAEHLSIEFSTYSNAVINSPKVPEQHSESAERDTLMELLNKLEQGIVSVEEVDELILNL